ncbi:creatininase family protein [Selenihalanaerobacter shriftii]|uniref:Creatinine amidohydrolase n=1 Tax=Selenihalanaerobacter shriftii TaxID=142842 RepID=A0A1T4MVJ7_9FIRM|nr:creatininase family protein [Selenihalanaerobacter shriftii]SJZ70993.1 creatinine amidohydrolase [Selenihalanaerobacter shriftii]
MSKKNAYLMEEMSWLEVEEALETVKVAVIPVGAHEQHGPNLAESCDAVRAREYSKVVGERMYPKVMITPTVNFGISFHHLNFPGTISLLPETMISLLRDIVKSLKHHGIEKFLFLNSHGGNEATLDTAIVTLKEELGVKAAHIKYTLLAPEAIKKHVKSDSSGHSCEREVSEALYLAPEIIKQDELTQGEVKDFPYSLTMQNKGPIKVTYDFEEWTENGALGDATKATKEFGKELVEESLTNLEEFITDFIEN